jgi:hypothetical protein
MSIYVEGFIAPNMRSRRSSTVQLISLVDSEEDAEWPGPRLGRLGRKLNDPESAPCDRFSINWPICAEELWKTWKSVVMSTVV